MTTHRLFLLAIRLFVLLSALCVLPCGQSNAAEFDPAKLAKIPAAMQKFVDGQVVSGAVVAVGSSKGIATLEAIGYQNLEQGQPMPKDALFRIASMTKPITALGIMILADEGKLSVEDPVEKHLPEFRAQMLAAEKSPERMVLVKPPRPITLRDLLTHTSGLPAFPPGLSDIYFRRDRTLAEMTLAMSQRPLDFPPGSKWAYCNPGIDTLGRIIEVVSGKPYETFLAERIFKPLGMSDTTFYPTPQQLERLAALYAQKEGKLASAGYVLIGPSAGARHAIPAGGLYSTASDLARLYQAMLQGGKLGETRIVSEAGARQMTQLQTGELQCGFTPGMGFGFGFAVVREPQGVTAMLSPGTFGHGGAFGTQGWIDPKQNLFVILLIQRTGLANADGSDLRRELQTLAVDAIVK
jgi:CubicO group peptidase (beta-lactamase class C family)